MQRAELREAAEAVKMGLPALEPLDVLLRKVRVQAAYRGASQAALIHAL
jgi:hypothetical protein